MPIALTVFGDLSWHLLQGARRGLRGCVWLPAQHTCVRPGICALISFVHTYIMHACTHAHIMHTVWVFPYMLHICKRLNCHQLLTPCVMLAVSPRQGHWSATRSLAPYKVMATHADCHSCVSHRTVPYMTATEVSVSYMSWVPRTLEVMATYTDSLL